MIRALRAAIPAVLRTWVGHLALVGASLWALQVHATYRVPAAASVRVLPWLAVAVAVTSVLMLIVSLLPRAAGGSAAGALDRLARCGWISALVIVTCFTAAAFATRPWLVDSFLLLATTVSIASVVAIGRRLVADGARALTNALRWLHRAALLGIAAFLLWTVLIFVNGALDRSAPVERGSDVLAVVTSRVDLGLGDLVPQARVELRSWRGHGGVEHLVLTPREGHHVWVGQPVNVRLHAGRLGIPWVSALTLDEARHMRQILAVSPSAFQPMRRLIAIALQRHRWDEALALARRYVELYPDDVDEVQFVAGYLGVAGRYGDQIELVRRLVARRPDYNSLCMLGFALDRSGDHRGAVDVLKRATRLRPDVFLALHYLGEAYQAQGRRAEAIAAYEAELGIRPQSLEVRRRVRALRNAQGSR